MKFKVGQKWKNREGDVVCISEILDGASYPIMLNDESGFLYSVGLSGAYFINNQWGSGYDLLELVEENKVTKEEYEEIIEEEKVHSEPEVKTSKSVNETLKQRGSVYGDFSEQLRCVTEIIDAMEKCAAENGASYYVITSLRSEWFYLAMKLARIASNPDHLDSYHDLAGYALLLEKEHEHTN